MVDPKNILLMNLGQVGDVILSLSAIRAVRERFPNSRLTLFVAKVATEIVEMAGIADEVISVDRVGIRKGNLFWSTGQILKILRDLRRRKFDLIIDLHSLHETNILGFLSGAKNRLYSIRGNRTLRYLSNFRPEPAVDSEKVHIIDFYAGSVEPLGVTGAKDPFNLVPSEGVTKRVGEIFGSNRLEDRKLIGLNIGAGHPSRASSYEHFGRLAQQIIDSTDYGIVVFAGPEETDLRVRFSECFPADAVLLDSLSLSELAAAMLKVEVVVGNDTGPMHLAASVGTPIVFIVGSNGQTRFHPVVEYSLIIETDDIDKFEIDPVMEAIDHFLHKKRK
ncbi:MAG: glycosyltransferase family 9 protein [Pyrinomonadaceae bacterium]|nr:glycosyltransferase family 9 protein [Pyrinomonadaceae bacterium]